MIPNFAVVHIENPHWRRFHLWIPLFLLWVPVILLSPIIFLVLLAACLACRINLWRAIAVLWGILCSLPGTDVHVRSQANQVQVHIL